MKTSEVTIIMATYNRGHFIKETLRSIQKQTFENWECIIVDDGGTDNTSEIVAPICEQDTRFQFVKRTSDYGGLPGCRNYIRLEGDYIIFF
jgi:glycosyltransferase involved in cell wall biosynthesis